MSRLLNQERAMRKPAPAEPINRLPQATTPLENLQVSAPLQRHPVKRGVVLSLLVGAPLAWYGWTHRPPDPWTLLLDSPPSPALLSPDIADLAVMPIPAAPALPADPPPVPLPFAQEHLGLEATIHNDLAIVVRTGRPAQPRNAVFPDDPALPQPADALRDLEDALRISGRR